VSRKDYVAIANIIKKTHDEMLEEEPYVAVYGEDIARAIALYFASDNPLFDKQKFFKACGIE